MHPLCEDGPHGGRVVDARPAAERGVADDAIDPGQAHALEHLAGAAVLDGRLGAARVAQLAVDEAGGKVAHAPEVAKIEHQAEGVDAGERVARVDVVGPSAGAQPQRGIGGSAGSIGADVVHGLEALGGRARRRDEDEVRGQGPLGEELVDEAAAAVRDRQGLQRFRLGLAYLLEPVMRTKSWSWAGTASHGAAGDEAPDCASATMSAGSRGSMMPPMQRRGSLPLERLPDSRQDQVLGLLDALLASHDLNGLVLGLVTRHLDAASALLPDRVDLASVRPDDVAVASGVVLLRLIKGPLDHLLGLGHALGRASQHPRDVTLLVRSRAHHLPRVRIRRGIRVVGDERQRRVGGPSRRARLGRHLLASVVHRHLVVVAQLPEQLPVVGHGVVHTTRDLHRLTLLLLDDASDVLLGLSHVLGPARHLDARLALALSGHVDAHRELRLHLALDVAAATNQRPVVVHGHLHDLGDLALALGHNLLDALDDVLHHLGTALHLDGVAIGVLLGELNRPGEAAPVIRAAGPDNNLAEGLVVLLVDVDGLHDGVVKDGPLLLENLTGLGDLRGCALDDNLNNLRVAVRGHVNARARRLAQLVERGATLANQGANLLLLDRHRGRHGVLFEILVQREDLVAGLVSTLLGAANDDLVGGLLAAGLAGLADGVGVGLVVGSALGRPREEDEHLVAVLQAVDLTALRSNQLPMELGVDLEDMRRLIGERAAEGLDVRASCLGLSLGSLELHLAVLNLNLHVEAVTQLLDVAATLADQVVGELLRELERQREAALLLLLLGLLNECLGLGRQRLDCRGRAAKRDCRTDLGHADGDLLGRATLLLLLDEASKLLMELGRHIQRRARERLLLVEQVKDVLARVFDALLEGLDLGIRRLRARDLVGAVGGVRAFKDEKDGGLGLRRVGYDDVHAIVLLDAGRHVVAEMLMEERLPRQGAVLGKRRVDMCVVELLEALNLAALTQVPSNARGVGGGSARGGPVEPRDVNVGHLHAHGEVHGMFQTSLDAVRRANDGDHIIVLLRRQQDGAARLGEEVISWHATVANNELVTAALNGQLLGLKVLLELSGTPLNFGLHLLHGGAVSGELDVVIVGTGGVEHRPLTWGGGDRRGDAREGLVRRDADLDAILVLERLGDGIGGSGEEGVEGGGDAADLGLHIGGPFAGNLEDLVARRGRGQGIALNHNIDSGVVIVFVHGPAVVGSGKLNTGTSLLLERLDHGAALADDMGPRDPLTDRRAYPESNLRHQVLEGLLSDLLRTSGVEAQAAIGGRGHGNIGPRLAVDVLEGIGNGSLQLSTGQDKGGIEGDRLDVAAGDEHGRGAGLRRGRGARGRGRGTRSAVGGRGAIRLAVGAALGTPDGGDVGTLALGGTELREQLMRLGVEGGLGLRLLLLAGGLCAHGGGPRARRVVGSLRSRAFLVGDVLDGDSVWSFGVLLEELLGGGFLAAVGEVGRGRGVGSHAEDGWGADRA
ncbi:hypothetical protein O9K51_09589 [Purpureocillium lavendulum]|uniref:Uncharacterized protein n=1 Tax=Purpureocillium lavendulum TaxID=1247861 RepID=A0AB34FG04_9HYPO|nr:hypothetical protein O9K51_09589 [Purpureocillium lavendulum]